MLLEAYMQHAKGLRHSLSTHSHELEVFQRPACACLVFAKGPCVRQRNGRLYFNNCSCLDCLAMFWQHAALVLAACLCVG